MIVLGFILLLLGLVTKVAIFWTLGIIALIVGAVLMIAGRSGHELGGRPHWY